MIVVEEGLPGVIVANSSDLSLSDWLGLHYADVFQLVTKHGALLFRGFDVSDASEFALATQTLTPNLQSYTGGATPRRHVKESIYTSTTYPAEQHLPLHCEATYFECIPDFVWFYCEKPPTCFGETPLGDMKRVLDALDCGLVERFCEKGLRYIYNLHGGLGFGRGWKDAFATEDRFKVEEWLGGKNAEFHWREDGSLHYELLGPVLREHQLTKMNVWGNQAVNWHVAHLPSSVAVGIRKTFREERLFPKHVIFADGSPIPDGDIHHILEVLLAEERVFSWERGDVLLCDNQRVAHGRRPFKGERSILVALA